MARYIFKRLLQSAVTVLLVVTVVFLLLRLMPTDYYFTEEELIKLTDQQKLDRLQGAGLLDPPLTQLVRFYKQLFTEFDLGTSRRIQANQPVVKLIADKAGVSMRLGLIALGISLACFGQFHGIREGTLIAARRARPAGAYLLWGIRPVR